MALTFSLLHFPGIEVLFSLMFEFSISQAILFLVLRVFGSSEYIAGFFIASAKLNVRQIRIISSMKSSLYASIAALMLLIRRFSVVWAFFIITLKSVALSFSILS